MTNTSTYDVVVIGAGVFGAWTAWHLANRGQHVLLLDAYGPAHSRASSGGESRIIRMSYGADEIYTRWSLASLVQWKALFAATGQNLFVPTGVLWLAGQEDDQLDESIEVLQRCDVAHHVFENAQLKARYPQINFAGVHRGVLELESGVLLARRAVACTVEDAVMRLGAQFQIAQIAPPAATGNLQSVTTSLGDQIGAKEFVFACGSWLGKLFPDLLGNRIFPTRQEVFFFGSPAGDARFATPNLPTWLFQEDEVYGMPDIENRGLKLARDKHGERVDPDTQSRFASRDGAEWARDYVARRFPAMKGSQIVETRVCQYENTSNGDFLIDRHPDFQNVWLAGGGSGHGFKHGPAFGECLCKQILDNARPEPRFSLQTKQTEQKRTVH
ncbi:MAG TPA: N-methyl-L-tryptophan oxidase [Candidatus Acidoferrum sp.]|jgi:monomeric sarcosine oxidase